MVASPRSITWPYYALDSAPTVGGQQRAIFFGADFYNMTEVDVPGFIAKTNQCLEYVRKKCVDCKLIYRPHPDERAELNCLNLTGFSVERDNQPAEMFLWANQTDIRYVFSVCSTSSIAGLNLGLNSYAFYKYFVGIFHGVHRTFVDKYFSDLPDNFFIKDLAMTLNDNKITIQPDEIFPKEFKEILSTYTGPLWFTVVENRFLLAIIALAKLTKRFFPDRSINLAISRHHRWQDETLGSLCGDFDQVIVFPRHFYSLRPSKLLSAWRTARKIKKLKVNPDGVFIGFAHHSFIENCFISYHPKLYKLAFLPEKTWEITYQPVKSGFDANRLGTTRVGLFYKYFFEPLLGLQRTSYRQHQGPGNLAFINFKQPLERLYSQVLVFTNTPNSCALFNKSTTAG